MFWTDSQVVLAYINHNFCWFKVFVIESGNNPVVDASRGLESKTKNQIKRWFNGPSFFRDKKQCWLQKCEINEVPVEDAKLKNLISIRFKEIQY